jgi:hypothetical protein
MNKIKMIIVDYQSICRFSNFTATFKDYRTKQKRSNKFSLSTQKKTEGENNNNRLNFYRSSCRPRWNLFLAASHFWKLTWLCFGALLCHIAWFYSSLVLGSCKYWLGLGEDKQVGCVDGVDLIQRITRLVISYND